MWDSDADKYWKEKQKEKRQAMLKNTLIGVVIALVLISWSMYVLFIRQDAPAATTENSRKMVEYPIEKLRKCKDSCREAILEKCNNICKFALGDLPRPTVYRACQGSCVKVGQHTCDVGTKNDIFRNQCRQQGQSLAHVTCSDFVDALPKPRMYQVCSIGVKVSDYGCQVASACLDKE